MSVLAVDVGGTKLAAALVDESGHQIRAARVTTPVSGIWTTLAGLCDEVLAGIAPAAVGVGAGGPMDALAGVVRPLNMPEWRDGFALRDALAERYGAPVTLANDAVAMALGEHWRGALRGSASALGVVVSTGVGGGLVVGGRPFHGTSGNAGHVGHVVVEPDGPPCGCGGRGCLEAVARGPAVAAAAGQPDGRGAAEAARAGDERAGTAFARAGRALGMALASTAALLDLDAVAIGGGLGAGAWDLLEPHVRAALADHARLDYLQRLRVTRAHLGPDAGVVGAAALVLA